MSTALFNIRRFRLLIALAGALGALIAAVPAAAATRHHRHCARHHCASAKASPARATTSVARPQVVPCANANLTPTSSDVAQVEAATLCLINDERALHGLSPLRDDSRLDVAAASHAFDMIANNYFDHTSPSGVTFSRRIFATGYVPSGAAYMLGENLGLGTLTLATPQAVVTMWMNSPEHRANILTPDFQSSGLAVVPSVPAQYSGGQAGATYVQEFGAYQS